METDHAQDFKQAFDKYYDKEKFQALKALRGDRKIKTILIVEDQEVSQKILERLIHGKYDIKIVENAINALKVYLSYAPDICFLDWNLPGVSGITFLETIKKVDPAGFIIMSTANSTGSHVTHALKRGADGYITKPFTAGKINKYLSALTHKSKAS